MWTRKNPRYCGKGYGLNQDAWGVLNRDEQDHAEVRRDRRTRPMKLKTKIG